MFLAVRAGVIEETLFRGLAIEQLTTGPRNIHALAVNDKTGKLAYLSNDFDHLDDLYVRESARASLIDRRRRAATRPRSG